MSDLPVLAWAAFAAFVASEWFVDWVGNAAVTAYSGPDGISPVEQQAQSACRATLSLYFAAGLLLAAASTRWIQIHYTRRSAPWKSGLRAFTETGVLFVAVCLFTGRMTGPRQTTRGWIQLAASYFCESGM